MLSIAKARKDYYLQKLGEITPREDYYLRGGTATGHWHGSGATDIGLEGRVSAEGLVRLFDGQHPRTGEQLGRQLRRDGVSAWDLTFSADKSVSLLWAFGNDEVRRAVVEAFEEATAEALAYLESVASSTRGASRMPVVDQNGRPVVSEDGTPRYRVETWPIRSAGYVAAWFTEFTSRADDPQLHTHVVVGNRVQGVDGMWRAIDGRLLYRHKLAAGYLHEAELRSRLSERLGIRWQRVRNGVADIAGFTRDQILAFSQRRREIQAWRTTHGLPDTAAANEVATLATRSPKRDRSLGALRSEWLTRGAEVGVTPASVAAVLQQPGAVSVPDLPLLFDRLASAEGLTAQTSTFDRADVIKATAEGFPQGARRDEIEALAGAFLRRVDVVRILPAHPHLPNPVELPIGLDPSDRERLLELAEATYPGTMRRRDGAIFPGLLHERRYTTAELVGIEQRIIDQAQDGVTAQRWAVPEAEVQAALVDHPHLTNGQQAMVQQFATSGSVIDVAVGAAGTGKTAVMAIIGQLASATGTPIVGTALAARAVAGFQTSTGIPSATITRFLWETSRTGGLPTGAVVVVDEAGMVGTRKLAEVSDLVERASGKLILIGDHHQLAEIDAGGLFAALAARLPAVELTENVRQDQQWERDALIELRDGSVARAVGMYDRRHKIQITSNSDKAMARAVDAWYRDGTEVADISQVMLIAHRSTTVDELNRRARQLMVRDGRLDGPAVTSSERQFQAGDRVICLSNRSRLGVLNGDVGTVASVETERQSVTIRLDRNQTSVTVPRWYLDDGHLDWGYALTGHKAQGATARLAHTVADDGIGREWVYVTMSRGREGNTIYLTQPVSDRNSCTHLAHQQPNHLSALVAALGRNATEAASVDTGRGPQILTDRQLDRLIADLRSRLDGNGSTMSTEDQTELLTDYVTQHREARERRRDELVAIAYQPPGWVVDAIGERPADPHRRSAWDRTVERAVHYRTEHKVGEDFARVLEPGPKNADDLNERTSALRSTNRDLPQMRKGRGRGESISR